MMPPALSASSIETFDARTPFGCERKWWFQYVQGIRPPQDPSAALGEAVHASIENYLKDPSANGLHPIALNAKHIIDSYLGRVVNIERKFLGGVTAGGIPLNGRIDLEVAGEVVDWKTTSDIGRYAKTVGGLRSSVQMNAYALEHFNTHPDARVVQMTLVYMQTKGKKAEKVSSTFDRVHVAEQWVDVEKTVAKMKTVADCTAVEQVNGDYEKCNLARGCPFREQCPRSVFGLIAKNQKGNAMSLLDRFNLSAAPVAIPAPAPAPVVAAPTAPLPVAAAPAEAPAPRPPSPPPPPPPPLAVPFEPVPPPLLPEKRGPGRPPGARNKKTLTIKDFASAPLTPAEPPPPTVAEVPAPAPARLDVTIQRVAVRHGLTINLGNYQSAKVEVEMEAFGRGADNLHAEVSRLVKAALEEEAKTYLSPPKAAEKP